MSNQIAVYVRKGSKETDRIITFQRPENTLASDLLDQGMAIDGNQVRVEVSYNPATEYFESTLKNTYPSDSMTHALLETERRVCIFLEARGLEAVFV